MERSEFRPGMIVARRERFYVTPKVNLAGEHILQPIDSRWELYRGRWQVWQSPIRLEMEREYGERVLVHPGDWVAHTPSDEGAETFKVFRSHAEAIAYADRKAREEDHQWPLSPGRNVGPCLGAF